MLIQGIIVDYIDNIKGVIIGGKPNWLLKMRKKLPSWTLIDPSSINFDKNILNNEHVFINTSYICLEEIYNISSS